MARPFTTRGERSLMPYALFLGAALGCAAAEVAYADWRIGNERARSARLEARRSLADPTDLDMKPQARPTRREIATPDEKLATLLAERAAEDTLREPKRLFEAAAAGFHEAADVATLASRAEFAPRLDKVRRFRSAVATLRQALAQLPGEESRQLAGRMRSLDAVAARVGELLGLLDRHWGKWRFDAAGGGIRFTRPALQKELTAILQAIGAADE
jgi:hypothetical protein